MSQTIKNQKRISMWAFIGMWMVVVLGAFALTFGPLSSWGFNPHDVFGIVLVTVPWLLPVIVIGRYLGPRLATRGLWRTFWHQLLASVIWSAFATLALFLVLFHGDVMDFFGGGHSVKSLFLTLVAGFPVFSLTFFILFLPATFLASAVAVRFLPRRS